MKYEKRPLVVEATLYEQGLEDGYKTFDETSIDPLERPIFMNVLQYNGLNKKPTVLAPAIHTMEGWMTISEGDYIITGIMGEKYPCKPDIFELTYREVEADDDTTS